jgi:hypothetical protein
MLIVFGYCKYTKVVLPKKAYIPCCKTNVRGGA